MLSGMRFRPVGWLVAVGTLAAMAATVVVAAPGGAATPTREYAATFEPNCVIGPGVLDVADKLRVSLHAVGPESVSEKQTEVEFSEVSSSITLPAELTKDFEALEAAEVRGRITRLVLDSTGAEPTALNAGEPAEYPEGLPFFASVEKEKAMTLNAPSLKVGETGRTYSFGPYTVTGKAGETFKSTIDSSAGFVEEAKDAYQSTGEGIILRIEGYKGSGEKRFGPLTVACTAPADVVVAEINITEPPSNGSVNPTCQYFPDANPTISSIEPSHGPESGGTSVTITGAQFAGYSRVTSVLFGGKNATSFHVNSESSITAIAPPGSGTVGVVVVAEAEPPLPACNAPLIGASNSVPFTYTALETAVYERWQVSGSLADARLGQPITLPEGSTFSGSAELNSETGAGSVNGQLSIPDFTNTFKLFGALPVTLGISLAETAPLEGSVSSAQAPSGEESLSMPLRLNLGITSVALLGLSIPTQCATVEPVALELADTLTAEELLKSGWSFTGTSSVPRFECHGGWLGHLFGAVLSALLSGPDNTYALSVRAAG